MSPNAEQLGVLHELIAEELNARAAVGAYRAHLAESCEHPDLPEWRGEWKHHKSNGFGRWRTEVMPYCKLCGKVRYNSAYNYKWGDIPVNNYDD